jgi:type II secretory pathway pseudopilin PulG
MICSRCGKDSPDGSPFCSTCGNSFRFGGPLPPIPGLPQPEKTSGMAIAGFVCSFVCGLLGLIFSAMGYSECKKSGGKIKGQGLALAGLIISIVSMGISVLGILAAIAIPAFVETMHVSKNSEAKIQLMKISRDAKVGYMTNAEYPRGTAPLTPAVDCCSQNAHGKRKCAGDPADWQNPVWQALDFQIYEPGYFQYSYTSDGHSFTALAVADLDCDGISVTYELHGRTVAGNPEIDPIIEPPPNSD